MWSLPLITDSRLVRSTCDDIDSGNVLFDRTYYSAEGKSADEADRWVGVYVCMLYQFTLLYLALPYPQQRPVTATHRIAVYVPGQLRRVLPEGPTGDRLVCHTLTAAQTPPLHLFIHLSIHPPIYPSIHPPISIPPQYAQLVNCRSSAEVDSLSLSDCSTHSRYVLYVLLLLLDGPIIRSPSTCMFDSQSLTLTHPHSQSQATKALSLESSSSIYLIR